MTNITLTSNHSFDSGTITPKGKLIKRNTHLEKRDSVASILKNHRCHRPHSTNTQLDLIMDTYSCSEEKAKSLLKSHPQFLTYGHKTKIESISELYKLGKQEVIDIILKFPQFAGYDHKKAIESMVSNFNWSSEQISNGVKRNPQITRRDHKRILDKICSVYSCTPAQASEAIYIFPQFAGYDHDKKLKRFTKLASYVKISEETVKKLLIEKPVCASYSTKRYIACLDIFRHLKPEEQVPETFIKSFIGHISKSPFIDEKRLTHALRSGNTEKPPLAVALGKALGTIKRK